MKRAEFAGVYTALITPFTEAGELDHEGFRENLRRQQDAGVDGVVVCGTTGEAPALSTNERDALIEMAVELVGDTLHVMVGAGTNSTAATIVNAARAKELGADSILVVTPYYNKPTQRGVYAHFEAITNAVDLPVLVYNHPIRTGVNIEPMTMLQIAELPHIVGVKEANPSVDQIGEVIHLTAELPHPFDVLVGDDVRTLPAMSLGAKGVISMLSNLAPGPVVAMVDALRNGEWQLARELHYRLLPLCKGLAFETNPIPVKHAMNLCNLAAGPCRLPLSPMSEAHAGALHQLLADSGYLPAGSRV